MPSLKFEANVSGSKEIIAAAYDDDGNCIGSTYVPNEKAGQVWFEGYIKARTAGEAPVKKDDGGKGKSKPSDV